MNFIINSQVLLKSLQAISGVLNSSNTLPILDDFLFELQEKVLKVTASDLETTMSVTLPLENAENPGSITVPAKLLLDTLKCFQDVPVTFNIDNTSFAIEISANEGKYRLTGHDGNEFPQSPVLDDTATSQLPSSLLAEAINKTLFATGNDELRPVMSGVYLELADTGLTFVATDAHKLVRYRRSDVTADNTVTFIMPKKPLNQLKNLLSLDEFPVLLEYNQTNASFTFKNILLICRLIEGRYPNYEAVIPKQNPNSLVIERIPFLNAVRRVSLYGNQSTHQIRLKITGRELVLSAEDIDYSNEAKERLSCVYEGEDIEIGFNAKFLQEMISNLDTDEVKMELSAPNRAGIIMPMENDNKDEDILMLVMPVMLNS
ncbi:MAG TPA: DNA polymerase III subunit beta [Bacteroidales bacterium]